MNICRLSKSEVDNVTLRHKKSMTDLGHEKELQRKFGKNFTAANRLFTDNWTQITREARKSLAIHEIKWVHIPRLSPSFSGLWESAVKSMKYFIKRMTHLTTLTYEEFNTLLIKIEGLLNSRPLTINPSSPDEDPALTANHFLNQRGLKLTSLEFSKGFSVNKLTKKYMEIQTIYQELWKRIQLELFTQMQRMPKWTHSQRNVPN